MRGPCAIDTTGPAISAITAPKVVTAGTTVTFTWRVTDTGGVGNIHVLIGGSAFDGTYQVKCDVPANAVNGSYTVLMASGSFGNASGWDASSQFDFSVTDGSTDALPPAVSDLSARVDGDSVVVRWQASDPSGVAGLSAWLAHNVYAFASIEGPYFVYNAATLVEGDATNGFYEQRIDRRQITPSGTFTVWLTVIDTLGNKSFDQTTTTVVL